MKTLALILLSTTLFFSCTKTPEAVPDLAPTLVGTYVGSYKSSKGFQSATYEIVITKSNTNKVSIKGVNVNLPNSAISMEVPSVEVSQIDAAIPDTPVASNKINLTVIKDTYSGVTVEGKNNPPAALGGFYYEVGSKKVVNIFFKTYRIEEPDNVTEVKFEGIKK